MRPHPAATSQVRSRTSLTTQNAHGETVTLSKQQLQRAAAIVAVGKSQNIPARGQLIALMTAITESTLRVLSNTSAYPASANIPNDGNGGDHDSIGLFQQRPAAGWGTVENLMDPVWSSRAFYGGPNGPNHGSPRGLLDLKDWQTMDLGAAAQAVQVSAYPDRYAVNQPVAAKILSALTGVSLGSGLCGGDENLPANLPAGFAGAFIRAAATKLGTPYVWGGGDFNGPTGGGFDCSGLVLYAAYQASGGRLRLPHYSGAQIHARPRRLLGRQAARRPDLLQLPRSRRAASRRDLRRRGPDPPGTAHWRRRALRDDRGVRRAGHDGPSPGVNFADCGWHDQPVAYEPLTGWVVITETQTVRKVMVAHRFHIDRGCAERELDPAPTKDGAPRTARLSGPLLIGQARRLPSSSSCKQCVGKKRGPGHAERETPFPGLTGPPGTGKRR
ncbi:MAG: NlpC/P60 family protein [Nocardioides sp.]